MRSNMYTLLAVLRKPLYAGIALISALTFWTLVLVLTDFSSLAGNLGRLHALAYTIINIILAVLVGTYLALFTHNLGSMRASGITGVLGTSAGMLVTGCSSCSFTLAGALGLGSFVALLPFEGLEINLLAIALLLFSIKKLTNPSLCSVRRRP